MIVEVAVVLASGLGAVTRYVVDRSVSRRTTLNFPFGTLLVNVTGALLVGLVTGLAVTGGLPAGPALVLSTGFTGGYTTLSTWAWESLSLARSGAPARAAVNVLGTFVAGLAAAAAGYALGRL